jgi:hypothetical protein
MTSPVPHFEGRGYAWELSDHWTGFFASPSGKFMWKRDRERTKNKPYCHCESEAATREIGLREGTTNEHE